MATININAAYTAVTRILGQSGFAGPTSQPSGSGSGFASTRTATGRWKTVPFQTVTGDLYLELTTIHANASGTLGIGRVTMMADGGPEIDAAVHSYTGVYGKTIVLWRLLLRASDFADGKVTIRGICYPVNGVPRVMPDLVLYTNANGTLPEKVRYVSPTGSDSNDGLTSGSPMQHPDHAFTDMWATAADTDQPTVYCLAGTYVLVTSQFPDSAHTNSGRWAILTAAPGVAKEDVILTATAQNSICDLKHLKVSGLTVLSTKPIHFENASGSAIWYHDCELDGIHKAYASAHFSNQLARYMTSCHVTRCVDGPAVYDLVSETFVQDMLADALSYNTNVIDVKVSGLDPVYATGINLMVDASTNTDVTPDGLEVGSWDVGAVLTIPPSPGWTPGTYTIDSIQGGTKWRLDSSPAATNTTGGHWSVDSGAHADIVQTVGPIVNQILMGVSAPDQLQAAAQGFVLATGNVPIDPLSVHQNIAWINSDISAGNVMILSGDIRHYMAKNCTFRGNSRWDATDQEPEGLHYLMADGVLDTCIFEDYDTGAQISAPAFPDMVTR